MTDGHKYESYPLLHSFCTFCLYRYLSSDFHISRIPWPKLAYFLLEVHSPDTLFHLFCSCYPIAIHPSALHLLRLLTSLICYWFPSCTFCLGRLIAFYFFFVVLVGFRRKQKSLCAMFKQTLRYLLCSH